MCADIKYPRVWLQVCVGISGSEFIRKCVCVSTSMYIHVHKCVCVGFIQHLKDLRQKRVGTSGTVFHFTPSMDVRLAERYQSAEGILRYLQSPIHYCTCKIYSMKNMGKSVLFFTS